MVTEQQVAAALPRRGFLWDYVRFAATQTDANIAYHVGAGLALLSQAVPIDFFVPFGGPLRGNLYTLFVGPSTLSRKSGAISVARAVLASFDKDRISEAPGSPEALIDAIRRRPQQVLFYSEFASLLSNSERGYMRPIKTLLTEIWDCHPIGRQLVRKKASIIDHPRLSVVAGCAPGYLEAHTEPIDWTEGFLARFLTFYGHRERFYDSPPYDWEGQARLGEQLRGLLPGDMVFSGPLGQCQGLDVTAAALWRDWHHKVERIALAKTNRPTQSAVGRAPGLAMKVAGLLAWDLGHARQSIPWQIGEEELACATAIVDLHIESVLEIGDQLAPDRDMRDRRRTLRAVGEEPTLLGKILREAGLTKRRAHEMIETLVEEQLIERVRISGDEKGTYYQRTERNAKVIPIRPQSSIDVPGDDAALFSPETPPES